jgi:DNA-binding NarL/FixJ family response regulator
MPGSGVAAAGEIKARLPTTKVVMLTISARDTDLFSALRAGADGYLLKDTDPARLPLALKDVVDGRPALPRELVGRVLEVVRESTPLRRAVLSVESTRPLTAREWQVLDELRHGRTTREIALRLGISPTTVRTHVAALMRKLGARQRSDLVGTGD